MQRCDVSDETVWLGHNGSLFGVGLLGVLASSESPFQGLSKRGLENRRFPPLLRSTLWVEICLFESLEQRNLVCRSDASNDARSSIALHDSRRSPKLGAPSGRPRYLYELKKLLKIPFSFSQKRWVVWSSPIESSINSLVVS